jgi:hypothetical protein
LVVDLLSVIRRGGDNHGNNFLAAMGVLKGNQHVFLLKTVRENKKAIVRLLPALSKIIVYECEARANCSRPF